MATPLLQRGRAHSSAEIDGVAHCRRQFVELQRGRAHSSAEMPAPSPEDLQILLLLQRGRAHSSAEIT